MAAWSGVLMLVLSGCGPAANEASLPEQGNEDSDPPVDEVEETAAWVPDDPCAVELPVLEVGTGKRAFEPLVEGQELALVEGTFSWHLPLAFAVTGMPQVVRVTVDVVDLNTGTDVAVGGELMEFAVAMIPPRLGDPWECKGLYFGLSFLVPPDGIDAELRDAPEDFCRHRMRIHIRLGDLYDGFLAEDAVEVILRADPNHAWMCP